MIAIHVSGPNAGALAAQAEAFLRDAFRQRPERAAVPPEPATTRTDPVAVASLMLSVPGAVLATLDLAERLRLAERLDRFLAALRAGADSTDWVQLCAAARSRRSTSSWLIATGSCMP